MGTPRLRWLIAIAMVVSVAIGGVLTWVAPYSAVGRIVE
jgi:hypothetical protein